MKKIIGKIGVPAMVLLSLSMLVLLFVLCFPAEARRVYGKTEQMIGTYSGVGSGQTHNIKASLDLAHTDLDAMITYDTDVLGLLGFGTGNIIYVDSATSGKTTGVDWINAVDDLDEGIALCTGDAHYTILIAPGHTEDVESISAINFDVADIAVYGLGNGENRPIFTLKTATTATIQVQTDDITLHNLIFRSDLADIAVCIDVNDGAENCTISNCLFDSATPGTDEFFACISIGDAADGITVENCKFNMGTGAAKYAILFDHDSDYSRIIGNEIWGDYATACIHNDGTDLCNNLLIKDNILYNGQDGIGLNAQPVIELKTTDTGVIANNICICDEATAGAAIVAADMHLVGNIYVETEGSGTALVVGQTYTVVSAEALTTSAAVDLFDVLGGPIEIISMWGHCTTVIGSTPGALTLIIDAGAGDSDAEFTTAVSIDALGAGDTVKMENVANVGESVIVITANENAAMPISWFCPVGMIEQATATTGTGGITWYMTFRPLVDGVTVTVQ